MDTLEFFRLRYEPLHSHMGRELLADLSEEQIRSRPHAGVNSIAWLLWHMTRCEDIGVNRLVADRPQVLDDEWATRLGLSHRDIATGMSDDEVSGLSERVDLAALLDYRAAVGRRTVEVLSSLRADHLDEVPGRAHLRRVVEEGALGPNAGWVEQLWDGRPKGWFLAQLGLAHNHLHFGEARVARGLLGYHAR